MLSIVCLLFRSGQHHNSVPVPHKEGRVNNSLLYKGGEEDTPTNILQVCANLTFHAQAIWWFHDGCREALLAADPAQQPSGLQALQNSYARYASLPSTPLLYPCLECASCSLSMCHDLLPPKKAICMMRVVILTSVLWGVRRVMMRLCGRWRSTTSNCFLHQQTRPFVCGILHPSAVSGCASLLAQPPSGPAAPVCLRIGCIMTAFLAQFHPALHLCILSRTYMCLRSWCALSNMSAQAMS